MRNRGRGFWGALALGGLGILLLLFGFGFVASTAQSPAAFGPEQFVRAAGAPHWQVRSFQLPRRAPDCTLTVDNGDRSATRVTSGSIRLNGRLVVRPAELRPAVAQVNKPVRLWKRNRLAVSLAGRPGSFLTVTIRCATQNTPPVADAGPAQTVPVGATVTLDGSRSRDADGDALTYAWTLQRPTGSRAVLSDPGAVRPTFTVDWPGIYTARLIVNDGQTSSAPATVAISTENSPPVADAGSAQTVRVGATVTLDGGSSRDVDGDELGFAWSFVSRPPGSAAALTGADTVQPRFTVDRSGDYTIRLVVDDGQVASAPATVVISTENSPPVADAGPDQSARVGETVTLDGGGSSDVDGDELDFTWSFLSRPAGSSAVLSDSSAIQPSFMLDQPGVYVVQLLVDDGAAESVDTVTVTTENSPPVAAAGPDQTVPLGATVTLNGGGSTDPDGDALSFRWALTTVPAHSAAVLSDATAVAPTFVADRAGEYVAQLIVNDGTVDSEAATVRVSTENSRPVADAGPAQTVRVGETVTLNGGGSTDPDSDPLAYAWALLVAPAESAAALSVADRVQTTFMPDVAGEYLAQLIVNDGALDSVPATVLVTATDPAPVNQAPVITSSPVTTATVGQPYTYAVSATDPDAGDVLTYSLPTAPTGMTVDADGLIAWTPDRAGAAEVVARVRDVGGLTDEQRFTIAVTAAAPDNEAPQVSADATPPTITLPTNSVTLNGAVEDDGLPDPPGAVAVTWTQASGPDGVEFAAADAAVTTATFPRAGTYVLRLTADDGELSASATVTITVNAESQIPLPPPPETVAPPVNPTVATTTFAATEFLYTGANPIQTGVAPGTIEAKRAAVLRGRVLDRDNQPLPGVTVTINNRPEFGQTLSRADGQFDLAVNGGGHLTLNYARAGYLPAQRQVNVPWQDFALAPDVVLIPLDSRVTTIDLDSAEPFQVAQGNPVTDADGTRQATLLFPQGTTATMTLPDGTTQPLSMLQVRATEYTVGPNGPQAMPAELPPTTAYTYAVELSVDEALAAGARRVEFDQPIPFYVDNFIGFPTGIQVPLAYYDPEKVAWVPVDDGRVIRILSISGGVAQVDTTGDGVADNGAALGMTEAERQRLATLYSAGQSLSRMAITHFTAYDPNYGIVAEEGAEEFPLRDTVEQPEGTLEEVSLEARPSEGAKPDACPPGQCCPQGQSTAPGSIIECESQILGQRIPLVGTGLGLNYRSDRVPGRKTSNTLIIPVSGSSVPNVLKRIVLEIRVAGRTFTQSFPAAPNQTHTFTWDGQDAYGRTLQGTQPVSIRIGYVYDGFYALPPNLARTFGAASGERIPGDIPAREEVILWQDQKTSVGTPDLRLASLGGWSLDVHHVYDPIGQMLYQGDGSRRSHQGVDESVITTMAHLSLNPRTIANHSDGSLFFAGGDRVGRVDSDGTITVIGGALFCCNVGDGGSATAAYLPGPNGIAVASDGTVFVSTAYVGSFHFIRRIGTDGIISTIAGTGPRGVSSDGGLANEARLWSPQGIAVAPDGNLYFVDSSRIRRVGPDGIITTVAGGGNPADRLGDGGPATAARLYDPQGVAVASDGSLYIADAYNHRIRRVGPDGIITTVAGTGTWGGFNGDGSPATEARLRQPEDVAVAPDGSLYIADTYQHRIRRVGPDGIITTVAGTGVQGFGGDGGPANAAQFNVPSGVAVAPDGSLYIADWGNRRIRRISPAYPGFGLGDLAIASEDGRLLYRFTAEGRHLSTVDTLTGATLYAFAYDAEGRLTSITDADNNIITIERDGTGNPTAIVAPFGQRTPLTVNGAGYLAAVTNPAGEAHPLSYTADGLLTAFTDPNGHTAQYAYDALGRLQQATDAAGAPQNLARADLDNGHRVNRTTALNRTTAYTVEDLTTGERRRTVRAPDNTETVSLIGTDGRTRITAPDGTVSDTQDGPDPRFGMQAPVTTSSTVTTGGRTATTSQTVAVNPANPTDPLSFTSLTRTATVNGRTATSVYTAATRRAATTSPANRSSYSIRDATGRPVETGVAGLEPVRMGYDARGRLVSVAQGTGLNQRATTFTYNAAGYLASATDPLGQSGGLGYDLAGRVLTQTLANGQTIGFDYDASGNLTALTPPGQPAHTFTYNAVHLATAYTPPVVAGSGATSTLYDYNADKQITRVTRPDGGVLDYGYDGAGRLSILTIPEGSYSYSYNTAGQLASIAAPGGVGLAYAYSGALLTGLTWSGPIAGSVGYGYDDDFRVNAITVDGANSIAYQYDPDSLLIQAGDLSLTRNAQNGLLTGTALGAATDSYTHNAFGELSGHTARHGATDLLTVAYTRDQLGRITEKTETVQGATTTTAYAYDLIGQLIEVRRNGSVVATYGYDPNGNRLSKTGPGLNETGTYDAQDRLLSYAGATYDYTANGELQRKVQGGQTTTYAYDALGNLRQVALPDGRAIEYLIDGQNRRIGKRINGSLVQGFLYQGQLQPVAELDGNGNLVSRFVYATGINVPDYLIRDGQTYRLVRDHLGSPRLVVNTADGAVVQRLDYDEYGQVLTDTNPGFQPFGFAGGIYDRDTGLVRFGARDYDPRTGRWTAKDPIGFEGKQTNFYQYSINDPVSYIDSSGNRPSNRDELKRGWDAFSKGRDIAEALRILMACEMPEDRPLGWPNPVVDLVYSVNAARLIGGDLAEPPRVVYDENLLQRPRFDDDCEKPGMVNYGPLGKQWQEAEAYLREQTLRNNPNASWMPFAIAPKPPSSRPWWSCSR